MYKVETYKNLGAQGRREKDLHVGHVAVPTPLPSLHRCSVSIAVRVQCGVAPYELYPRMSTLCS